jgi:MoaA/NifB/PqqE/SkfB family radical SAM enzyme
MNVIDRFRRRAPRLDWVQLEVTSRCNAACTYCPRTTAGARWQSRDLPLELLDELLPALARTPYVHLQGWGEPLLHPDLLLMVERLGAAGIRVGTTSNGILLDRPTARALVGAGVEVIALSAAGTDCAGNDPVRRGTNLEQIVAAARLLREARGTREKPRIHLAYMLLRSGLPSIEQLPDLVGRAGVDEVVVSSLSFLSRPEHRAEAVLAESRKELATLRERLAAVQTEVEQRGARIHWHLFSPLAGAGDCPENVQRAVVIGAGGEVHPCVLTGVPVTGELATLGWTDTGSVQLVSHGHLGERSLGEIRRARSSRTFRERLLTTDPPSPCRRCIKRWGVRLDMNPLPLV